MRLSQDLRKMSSENARRCTQNAENGFPFDFLERYLKDGDEFLNRIVQVTGDETWISFVNVETKEQSKQWMHTQSPNKLKEFKQTSACQNSDGSCFLGHERCADGRIMQQGTTTMLEVYYETPDLGGS
jgi:hypothetical protein